MNIKLQHSEIVSKSEITITGSKSESNRLLILKALYPEIEIHNLSNADDTELLKQALISNSDRIDIHHAGTAMRFLTAYFAIQNEREVILTGSERMQERPIKILVDALKNLGAEIEYVRMEGYPPLKIQGQILNKNIVSLNADVSSQYISALLLIGSKIKNGLELSLKGEVTSRSYIEMTLALLNKIEIETSFDENIIRIKHLINIPNQKIIAVESDWSSASYYYSCVALSKVGTEIQLSSYNMNSLQGDSVLTELFKDFGVSTRYSDNAITIKKEENIRFNEVNYNLISTPDLAQTIAVTCLGLNIECKLEGLHTLKIKETDRLEALKTEIEKFGALVSITNNSLFVKPVDLLKKNVVVNTYNDHRMAMAFASLALVTSIQINDANVVSKSYPDFWDHLEQIGFKLNEF